jgi:hypothetical protein
MSLIRVGLSVAVLICASAGRSGATEIVNGSFENGFNGWITQEIQAFFFPLSVNGAGATVGLFDCHPTDGVFAAIHGFDGDGPGAIRLAQDIAITPGSSRLRFDYRAGWDFTESCVGCAARVFTVRIEPAGGGAALASFPVLTAEPGTFELDSGELSHELDLDAFAGQTVRVSFDFDVPDSFSGGGFFQLDHVRVARTPWLAHGAVREHDGHQIRWRRIAGLQDAHNAVGSGNGQVLGASQPWSTTDGAGSASLDLRRGKLSYRAVGLVLAGGNDAGTPGSVREVRGTLVCDTDGSAGAGDSVLVEAPAVRLSPAGDVSFSGYLETLPEVCRSEPDIAFLIRSATPEPAAASAAAPPRVRGTARAAPPRRATAPAGASTPARPTARPQ